jgi:hypothetical protein
MGFSCLVRPKKRKEYHELLQHPLSRRHGGADTTVQTCGASSNQHTRHSVFVSIQHKSVQKSGNATYCLFRSSRLEKPSD